MTAEEFLQSKDIWNHPMVTDRTESNGYEVEHLLEDFARQAVHQALDEAARQNYEMYRSLMDTSDIHYDNEEDQYKYRRMRAKAAGYKYAAKQTQELKEKYQ